MLGIRSSIARQIRGLLSDPANPRIEIVRDGSGLFAPDSVSWRVHIDVTGMMVGGIAALMLQMLHPKVLAGVWDHSGFRDDMNARLRGTARFIAQTTFETRTAAEAQIARVRHIHDAVSGTLPDGTPYSANDPRLLAWVHVAEATSFLAGWIRYGEPGMSLADQDRYFDEIAIIGDMLGADPVPHSLAEAHAIITGFLPELKADERSREVLRLLMHQRPPSLMLMPFQALTMNAAIELLPDWARRMHALPTPTLSKPVIRVGTRGIAQTVRWALRE
ncbi:MAG: oxygenase MpaB family protein [Pseudomonadota bacterium]